MTRRFLRTETLIHDDLRARLIENGRVSEEREDFDPFPVVKLFTPDAGATQLITEAFEEPDGDLRLYGLCDLGLGSPELGYVMLSEIAEVWRQLFCIAGGAFIGVSALARLADPSVSREDR